MSRDLPLLVVSAAVIRDPEGSYLLARRPAGSHMAGLWEFPGGKTRARESPAQALARELSEELGVTVSIGRPLTFVVHDEADRRILLLFFETRIEAGTPRGLEGQEVAWVRSEELVGCQMPPGDTEFVGWLTEDRDRDRDRERDRER
jgi:8-oxo-dGTP diphosphatase